MLLDSLLARSAAGEASAGKTAAPLTTDPPLLPVFDSGRPSDADSCEAELDWSSSSASQAPRSTAALFGSIIAVFVINLSFLRSFANCCLQLPRYGFLPTSRCPS